jgi:DNA-binding transcriptional LysR family regulator
MNWDDLKIFLAVSRNHSLSAAGRSLGISQPTVSRRLAAMEARLGVRLFDRTARGYELSDAGSDILETVQHVEEELTAIERTVFGQDRRLSGSLRVTCTEVLANLYLTPHLARFVGEHPGVDLSVVCTFQHLSLSRREADVAIRVTSQPQDTLVGRRVAHVAVAVYAGRSSFEPGADRDLPHEADWIGWQDEAYNRMMVTGSFPKARIRHRVDDMQTMRAMARAGLGLAMLPCYMADPDPGLVRAMPEPVTDKGLDLWILTHPAVKRVARVRAFTEFISRTIVADRDLFEGRRPHGTRNRTRKPAAA